MEELRSLFSAETADPDTATWGDILQEMAAPIPKAGGGSPQAEAPATARVPAGHVGTAAVGPFRLGRTPVTNIQYAPFLETGRAAAPPWWNDPEFSAPARPVVGVTWHESVAYAGWLGEIAGGVWCLPTEAEWEHAACGGLRAPRTAWGDVVPAGEIPEGPLAAPWE